MTKYIFITGGVVSGIGKGINAASLGMLLKNQNYSVAVQKLDPYINVDPGTMSPLQHGEVYVTADGAETDLDLGHYERFIGTNLSSNSSHSAGKIYETVINNERNGKYGGGTVQVIPHITDEIKRRIYQIGNDKDFCIVEIGGTVGDIESQPFLEAIRQIRFEVARDNTALIHTTLVPYLSVVKESKTKPTQHSINTLRSHGLNADFIILRTEVDIDSTVQNKIAMFANVPASNIIVAKDVSSIYKVPIVLNNQDFGQKVAELLNMDFKKQSLSDLIEFVNKKENAIRQINVAIIGKYNDLEDAYFSINEALDIAATHQDLKLKIKYVNAENITNENIKEMLQNIDAILVPGGFGQRAAEGKITAIKYSRENEIPFLGICYGMQLACIEYARNVLNLDNANTTEINPDTAHPIFDLLEGRSRTENLGGTMRLGELAVELVEESKIFDLYDQKVITERHRHRYEFNNKYRKLFTSPFLISGYNKKEDLVETIELEDHPYFIAVQFHPEFTARPLTSHPLFDGLIKAGYDAKTK